MYEELITKLRSQCRGYGIDCEECDANGNCRSQMEYAAADAIEELSNAVKELKKLSLEMIDKYFDSAQTEICEYSGNVSQDLEELDEECEQYRKIVNGYMEQEG